MKSHNYEDHGRIKNASQEHGKGSHGRRVTAAGINAAGQVTAVEIESGVSPIQKVALGRDALRQWGLANTCGAFFIRPSCSRTMWFLFVFSSPVLFHPSPLTALLPALLSPVVTAAG